MTKQDILLAFTESLLLLLAEIETDNEQIAHVINNAINMAIEAMKAMVRDEDINAEQMLEVSEQLFANTFNALYLNKP